MKNKEELSQKESYELLKILKDRFEGNKNRYKMLDWNKIEAKLTSNKKKLWSINQMEITGGEPDVIDYDPKEDQYIFYDCAPESPKGRRSLCYDAKSLDDRKEFKPEDSAINRASEMGIELLTEENYRILQKTGKFDTKTSSWLVTPPEIRKLGGAIFADFRYNTIFIYHNGASSYYASRGFRGLLRV